MAYPTSPPDFTRPRLGGHPATAGVIFRTVSGTRPDAVNAATPLSLLHAGRVADASSGATPVGAVWLTSSGRPTPLSLFLGLRSGSIGEISILALLLGGLYLIWRGTINWRIPLGILASFALFNLATGRDPLYHLLSGGLVLGAFFMANDWVTSPMSHYGTWIYAVGIGVTVAMLRTMDFHPEGVAVAILKWNLLSRAIDRLVVRPRFGEPRWRILNLGMPCTPGGPGTLLRPRQGIRL